MPPTWLWFLLCPRYLFNGIRFYLSYLASREFLAVCIIKYAYSQL